jgi:transposase
MFAMGGGVVVQRVELADDGARVVHVITKEEWAGLCPWCGRRSSSVKDQATTSPNDLPYGRML